MLKKDMSEKQLAEKNLFVQRLRDAGWDVGGTDELLEGGFINVTPEGRAEYQNEEANLELTYHAEGGYIALLIGSKNLQDFVRFRFHCGEGLAQALDLVADARDTLSLTTHPALIEKVVGVCDDVLMEVGDGNLVRLSL